MCFIAHVYNARMCYGPAIVLLLWQKLNVIFLFFIVKWSVGCKTKMYVYLLQYVGNQIPNKLLRANYSYN